MYSIPCSRGSPRKHLYPDGVVVVGGVAVVNIVGLVSDEQLAMKSTTLIFVCVYVNFPQLSDTCRSVLHVSSEGAPSALHSARRQATNTCTATVHILFTYLGDSCHTPVTYLEA